MDILFSEKLGRLESAVTRLLSDEPGFFAIAVHDLHTNQLWQFHSQPMRSASLIKLFIMAEAFAQIDAGQLNPTDRLAFAESDRVGGAGLLQELPAGTSRTVLELIELMITESDNIATNLLIDCLGMDKINARIRALDCHDSILRRKMMDFSAAAAGLENLTSVSDATTILVALYHGRGINASSARQMCEILERQTDRCKLPLLLPSGVVCKHKTGELPGAEHDAGIVIAPGCPYVLAIMSDNLPDSAGGCQTIAEISRTVYDVLTTNQ